MAVTSLSIASTTTLNNGVQMPRLGLGVFKMPDGPATGDAVLHALKVGYRHIDTASVYENEHCVGEAVRKSGVPRSGIFITTKLWNSDHGYDSAIQAFHESLNRLGLDYVDLYLIHWPVENLRLESWRALETLLGEGKTRAIGVSNYMGRHLEELMDYCEVTPAVNQIELHPYLPQTELRALHAEHGIATEAWSPLAQGGELLSDPTITRLAERHGVTPAQVVLRWHLQLGNIVIPKSTTPTRIQENFDVFGFELSTDDLDEIAHLENGGRIGPDPAEFNVTSQP